MRMGIFLPENISLVKRIGEGAYGSVYRIGKDKVLKIAKDGEAIKKFDHPLLLSIERLFWYEAEKLLLIVSPYYELGHLRGQFTLGQYWSILCNLTNALKYLHSQQVVHRDIKPANILVEKKDKFEVKVVLADFGLAKSFDSCSAGSVGTTYFVAPELMKGYDGEHSARRRVANEKSDIFSLGKTISVLILNDKPEDLEFKKGNSLTELLNRMMKYKPENRPSTDEIISICEMEISKLSETDYNAIFKLSDNDIEIFDEMSFYTESSLSDGLLKMLISGESSQSQSAVKHSYTFDLHDDGVVNAKKIIHIKCTPEARLAIESIYLRIYNTKFNTGLIDVTNCLSKSVREISNDNEKKYAISGSQKQYLIPAKSKYQNEKGKDTIELYINNRDEHVASANYVAKNNKNN
ncbi:predicted protein [Naegleria gruberi]|uniref:non-specific serine/threonine protein kinase n=1 Tax=Naegleria gruberi TaxID=5762 RepID=D2VTJ4_NAEGR|nr:uncharacterized protein NAEGRDRAFT_72323 [Naegleria gruberi]EFC39871.1 predicted protein [Naegleria gruberi]|eukprot:XP_002672615.1 predicted protein [Naegleria gruberi strain NEG-M]